MNEFTKEELKDLASWLSEIHHDSFDDVGYMIKKIESMIDNYCEHEHKKTLDKSGMNFIKLCHKCMDRKPWTVADDLREEGLKK